jgi:mono/diheme cytochrome c family protein
LRSEQAAFGRALFRDACAACHGATGAGDGIAAAGLQDSQGKAIKPADLRKPLRSGPELEDVFRTIMTGITDTPMMGFDGAFKVEQGWQLAAYVLSLQPAKP